MSWTYNQQGHVMSSEMDKHPFEAHIRSINTTHRNRAFPMKTLGSTSTRSSHKWYHGTSKPAIPHVDAQLHNHSFETHTYVASLRCSGIDTGDYAGMGPGVCQG